MFRHVMFRNGGGPLQGRTISNVMALRNATFTFSRNVLAWRKSGTRDTSTIEVTRSPHRLSRTLSLRRALRWPTWGDHPSPSPEILTVRAEEVTDRVVTSVGNISPHLSRAQLLLSWSAGVCESSDGPTGGIFSRCGSSSRYRARCYRLTATVTVASPPNLMLAFRYGERSRSYFPAGVQRSTLAF